MGIPGLLEHLKSVIYKSHISEFSGKSVAVDAHCWLHRGAFACSKDLVQGNPTEKYITFFMSMINMLKNNGISSILIVFDGLPLPNKFDTNLKRSDDRKKNIGLAREAETNGDRKLAMTYYQRSVSVTFDMIKKLLVVLDKEGVSFMISPYEADAQLAFLSRNNTVDLIITEDSDAIPYGCSAVMFKMDREGYGELFEQSKLHTNHTLSFANWTEDQFKLFCCLSGCDYMPGLRNFGIKTAYKVVHKYKTLSKVLEHLSFSNAAAGYEGDLATRLEQALLTFKHQTIFNPFSGCTEPLTPLPLTMVYLNTIHNSHYNNPNNIATAGVRSTTSRNALTANTSHTEFAFLGPLLEPTVALQLARGKIDPKSIDALHTCNSDSVTNPTTVFATAESDRPLPSDHIRFTGFGATDDSTHESVNTRGASCSTPIRQGQSSTGIRWFSSEDRALHTAHAQQRLHSSTSTRNNYTSDNSHTATSSRTSAPVGHTVNHRNNTTTVALPSVGRKRGRSVQHSVTNHSHLPHSNLTSISTVGAMSATSAYQSDLISDNLAPLHRRTRLRSTEPSYSTTYPTHATSRDASHLMNTAHDSSEYHGDRSVDNIDYDIWDAAGDQTDSWDRHSSFPTVNTTSYNYEPTRKGSTFFKDVDTTDYSADYTTHLDSPILNTIDYIGDDYELSNVDDDCMCTTEDFSYNGPANEDFLLDSATSFAATNDFDIDYGNGTAVDEPAAGGLKQFQDTEFDSRFAHQYTLHPVLPVDISSRSNTACSHVSYTSTSLPQYISSVSSVHDSSHVPSGIAASSAINPCRSTSYNTTGYMSHYPTNNDSIYCSSTLSPPYTPSTHTEYTNNNSYSAQFLHNASVQEECWKHQQFPGLLHS